MESGLITCLWIFGGFAVLSLMFQLFLVYTFLWGKNYQMKYKGKDGKEITINGDISALRAEIKKELKEDIKEIIEELQNNKSKK